MNNGRQSTLSCPVSGANNMFDLEQAISEWRRQMLAAGIKTPVPLEELESHLCDEIEQQIQSGTNEQHAFEAAVQQIGHGNMLKTEFRKVGETKGDGLINYHRIYSAMLASKQKIMKKITNILVTLTFAFACFSLWIMLTLLSPVAAHSLRALPPFTTFLVGMRAGLLLLPIPVAGYCLYAVLRSQPATQNGTTFLAWTMSALFLVSFPVLLAIFLPCLQLMIQMK